MFRCTKLLELGSCAFKQPRAASHCRHNHGYQLKAKFWFTSKDLDINHWVVDFGGLKNFKSILKDQFDHTTCLAFDDPHLDLYKELERRDGCKLRVMPKGTGIERIAEWCYTAVNKYLLEAEGGRCKCTKVEVFEHQDNSAIYDDKDVQEVSDLDSWSGAKVSSAPVGFVEELIVEDKAPEEVKKSDDYFKDTTEVVQPEKVSDNKTVDGNPLYGKKQTNKWIDTDSKNVWGW